MVPLAAQRSAGAGGSLPLQPCAGTYSCLCAVINSLPEANPSANRGDDGCLSFLVIAVHCQRSYSASSHSQHRQHPSLPRHLQLLPPAAAATIAAVAAAPTNTNQPDTLASSSYHTPAAAAAAAAAAASIAASLQQLQHSAVSLNAEPTVDGLLTAFQQLQCIQRQLQQEARQCKVALYKASSGSTRQQRAATPAQQQQQRRPDSSSGSSSGGGGDAAVQQLEAQLAALSHQRAAAEDAQDFLLSLLQQLLQVRVVVCSG